MVAHERKGILRALQSASINDRDGYFQFAWKQIPAFSEE